VQRTQQTLQERQRAMDALFARAEAAEAEVARRVNPELLEAAKLRLEDANALAARRVDISVVEALRAQLAGSEALAARRVGVGTMDSLRARLAATEALAAARVDPADVEVLQTLLEEARADAARKVDPAMLEAARTKNAALAADNDGLRLSLEQAARPRCWRPHEDCWKRNWQPRKLKHTQLQTSTRLQARLDASRILFHFSFSSWRRF
jgi:hypothetical protein